MSNMYPYALYYIITHIEVFDFKYNIYIRGGKFILWSSNKMQTEFLLSIKIVILDITP